MIDTRRIEAAPGMVFDASIGGAALGATVLMLHGFGVSRYLWNAQVLALARAGFLAVAPNQRGYAVDARPDPSDHGSYRVDLLIRDVFDIVAALGHADRRFHLVGHDWGASLAWQIADQHPERLGSLTILSRPHPLAFNRALNLPDGEQARRSRHHTTFLHPSAGANILADDAKWLRTRLAANGVPPAAIEAHLSVIGNPAAMEAALAWYRARGVRHQPLGPISVPTCMSGAMPTTRSVEWLPKEPASSSPRRTGSKYMPGVGHYAADQVPDRVNGLLLEHLARHPV